MWIYAIKTDGDLLWYRKDTGASPWQGPKKVGNGWAAGDKEAIPAGGNSLYLLSGDGILGGDRHNGYADGGGPGTWVGPKAVGSGWGDFKEVFSTGQGQVYAVRPDGTLLL